MFVDARIPVVFGIPPGPLDAVIAGSAEAAHPLGCACCLARGPAAALFDELFLARVHGRRPWFTRVVVPAEDAAIRATVLHDQVVASRFRLG